MDVYHKILTKIYEATGGKDTVEVDLNDLLKREGFFSNIDSIASHLTTESWVAETPRPRVVLLTHWGAAEAKRVLTNTPDKARNVTKDSNRMLADVRELVIMLEEFAADPSENRLAPIGKRLVELNSAFEKIKANF